MKKKRQKSFSKKSRKAKQQKRQQQQQAIKKNTEQGIVIPSNSIGTNGALTNGAFNLPKKLQLLKSFIAKISSQAETTTLTSKTSKALYISSHQLIGQLLAKSAIRSLDDKTKFLYNIEAKVLQVLNQVFNSNTKTSPAIASEVNCIEYELPPLTREELESYTVDRSNLLFQQTTSTIDIKAFERASCSSVSNCTKSCANIFLNSLNVNESNANKCIQKSRPSYIIEKDTHVFGGCVDEDADDEFFISSGAVYQSWPYVYEPGFQMQPLPMLRTPVQLSMSDEAINYADTEGELNTRMIEQPTELTTYSLHNYGINLFHVDDQTKVQKKRRRRKHHRKDVTEFHSLSTSSSYFESDLTDDSDSSDDDTDSYRAYKERHAMGLNNFKFNQSQSSLSDLGNQQQMIGLGLFKTNLYHTDSSSCDEYSRLPSGKRRQTNARMATSFHTYDDSFFGDYGRNRNMFGKAKFSSYNHQCLSTNNLIF